MKKTIIRTVSTTALFSTLYAGSALADTYKVQKGDTLSKVASKTNTTVQKIKEQNNLKTSTIYVNQVLQISTTPQTTTVQAIQQTTYQVASGDALIKVANRYGVSVGELQQWNGLKGTMIYAGQVLKVSAPGKTVTVTVPLPAPSTSPSKTSATPSSSSATSEYTIKSGDSLSMIGLQFGMTVQEIKTLNHLNSDLIYVGQKLKVTGKSPATPSAPAPAKPTAASEHVVSGGDTLGGIAVKYDMTVQELKALNNLTSTLIFSGQKLKVTGQIDTAVPQTNLADAMIKVAKDLIGTRYIWGGSTLAGFDCSGFIYYVANQAGMEISRTSAAGYYDRSYYVENPVPGDIVFFENTYKQGISHLGIYLGNDQFIHADEAHGIMVSTLKSNYYTTHFAAFKRFY